MEKTISYLCCVSKTLRCICHSSVYFRGWQTFSAKGQIANILGFVGHTASAQLFNLWTLKFECHETFTHNNLLLLSQLFKSLKNFKKPKSTPHSQCVGCSLQPPDSSVQGPFVPFHSRTWARLCGLQPCQQKHTLSSRILHYFFSATKWQKSLLRSPLC